LLMIRDAFHLHGDERFEGSPPSSDSRKDREYRRARRKGTRRRSAQSGHEGSHRELLPPEKVDKVRRPLPVALREPLQAAAASADPPAKRYHQTELPPIEPTRRDGAGTK
jgi:hypothetical protein